jgi:hypothetical protein
MEPDGKVSALRKEKIIRRRRGVRSGRRDIKGCERRIRRMRRIRKRGKRL